MSTEEKREEIDSFNSSRVYLERKEKLQQLRNLGVEPYPNTFVPQESIQSVLDRHGDREGGDSTAAQEGQTEETTIAGRLILFRAMGKNAFFHLQGETGQLQVMANRLHTNLAGYSPAEGDPAALKILEKKCDLGDLLGVRGHLFRTHKGELTLYAKEVTILCKALLPLPDKHCGLVNKEMRYRKRWIDLICHQDIREVFVLRSKLIQWIRAFFYRADFMEVETPVLQTTYGGAEAEPFSTHLKALDQSMFLRISLEPDLKKLLVGGHERIFEIGKVFRNEGIDRTHNPEFTLLEAYRAYWDYRDMMTFVEQLFAHLAKQLFGRTTFSVGEHEIDVQTPWTRWTMRQSLLSIAKLDVDAMSDDDLRQQLLACEGVEKEHYADANRGILIATLFEELVEPELIQPCHILDHPIETTPFCKLHRDPQKAEKGEIERFESFILGKEICNAYSELNDAALQRELFERQAGERKKSHLDIHPIDEEFIEALSIGMPPAGGIGIGIDRLVMLFTQQLSIRDVIYFPLMRRE